MGNCDRQERQERRAAEHATSISAAPTYCLRGSLGVLIFCGLTAPATAQISADEIAALRDRGVIAGWTFTVGETNATRSPLHELCGAVEPPDSDAGADFDLHTLDRPLPPVFSWLAAGACPPIRDQRPCSACWAFSAIATLESAILIQGQINVDLSEQWLLSCTDAGDCVDGWHYTAFQYLKCGGSKDPCRRGGAVLEADFPYQAAVVPCDCPHPHSYCLDSSTIIASGWGTTEQIKQAIFDHGPVAACVYVNDAFRAYTGGVFNACEDHLINHIVVLVGWDDSLGEHGAWLVRNSWGTDWGEAGYMWIEYTCSRIGYRATHITYQPHDCNGNAVNDHTDIANGTSPDCNNNGAIDACDIIAEYSADVNQNGIPDECEQDCNNNGFPDNLDIAMGTSADCNANAAPDECDIANGTSRDCNTNNIPDSCDIASELSHDVNGDGIPDECEPDCNHNSVPDAYELAQGASADCNYNNIPDDCDIAAGTSPDANANAVPDECESDCNGNGRPDSFDLATGTSHDCNRTGTPDECDIANGAANDVNGNGWPDECEPDCNHNSLPDSYELSMGLCTDCNHNATPDDCDLAAGSGADCNGNGILDACDLAIGARRDCNLNRVPDECDLATGTSADADGDGLPDECDPCASTQWGKRRAADGVARDDFGRTIAMSGDTALVGARLDDDKGTDSGSAYVFRFDGATWAQEAKLLAGDGKSYDYFGTALAISGDLAAIGAPLDDDHGINSGSVYVFRRTGSTWSQAAKITPADGAASDAFGISVALSESILLVGANADDDRGTDAGSAYVFAYNGTSWVQQAKFLAADGAAYDDFGVAVALAGETAVIGADKDDDRGANAGAAYVLRRSGTIWTGQGKLLASDGAAGDQFGAAVAISGETALIGAARHDHNGADAGAAYVFRRQGSSWVQEARLWASDGAAGDWFGVGVAISGDMAVVGAPHDDDGGSNAGKGCVFVRQGATWTQTATLRASDGSAGDELGTGVALSGAVAVLGAFGDDDLGTDAGAVHVFRSLVDCNGNAVLDICDLTRGISADVNANGVPDDCEARRGDLNCDGSVDWGDINPFVQYLASLTAWQASYPGCPALNGDINSDGTYGQLSFGDINPFVALLTGG